MLATASILPSQFAFQTFGFECPLHTAEATCDLLVSARRDNNGAGASAEPSVVSRTHDASVWKSVEALLKALAAKPAEIDDVWLEFDLNGAAPQTPNLFLRPLYSAGDAQDFVNRMQHLVPLVAGTTPCQRLRESLLRHVRALPPRAFVFQIGAMRARPAAGLRLCVREISLDGILRYLDDVNYPGDLDAVHALLVRVQPAVGDVALNLDLAPELQKKIGLECYFGPDRAGRSPRVVLSGFLERIVADTICTGDKAAALLDYARTVRVDPAEGEWPHSLLRALALAGADACTFDYWVHHVKLVCQPGEPVQAKAYLAVRQQWR